MRTTDDMTLEGLEKEVWPEPSFASHLVATCHRLRKKKLRDFDVEDFRIMLGQSFGAIHLLPRAIAILREDPFAEGDFFEGDLLVAIARHPENASLLTFEDAKHLRAICFAAVQSIDPKLQKSDLRLVESLLGKLDEVLGM